MGSTDENTTAMWLAWASGASEDHDDFGLQRDYVLAKAAQHLRCGLASDPAVEVGLAGEIFVEVPDVGDGVSEENDAVLAGCGRLEGGVGVTVAGELSEIVGEDGDAPGAVLVEAGESGGGDGGRGGLCCLGGLLRRDREGEQENERERLEVTR